MDVNRKRKVMRMSKPSHNSASDDKSRQSKRSASILRAHELFLPLARRTPRRGASALDRIICTYPLPGEVHPTGLFKLTAPYGAQRRWAKTRAAPEHDTEHLGLKGYVRPFFASSPSALRVY